MWEKEHFRHQGQCRRRGRRCPKCWSRDSPAAPGADHGEATVPLEPMGFHSGTEIHLQSMEDPTAQTWRSPAICLKEGWDSEGPHFSDSLKWPVTVEPMCRMSGKECSLWEGCIFGKFITYYLTQEGPLSGAGEECEKNEWERWSFMNWPQTPFPIPLCCLKGRGREVGTRAKPGKKGGTGKRCFYICSYFWLFHLVID